MTRGMRLLIVFSVFVAVVVLMMDCTKKTMRKKKLDQGGAPEGGHGILVPDALRPAPGGAPLPAGKA